MPKYSVDVKAFISVEVEADNPKDARRVADTFVENGLWADENTVNGYNSSEDSHARGKVRPAEYSPTVDGTSEVERLCDDCGETTDDVTQARCDSCDLCGHCHDPRCDGCSPPDTDVLDTSFHDHEMDV